MTSTKPNAELHGAIRTAGGRVHSDGNIFFKNADAFMCAARTLRFPPSYEGSSLIGKPGGACSINLHFGNTEEAERWLESVVALKADATPAATASRNLPVGRVDGDGNAVWHDPIPEGGADLYAAPFTPSVSQEVAPIKGLAVGPCGQCKDSRQPCACTISSFLAERGQVAIGKEFWLKIFLEARAARHAKAVSAPQVAEHADRWRAMRETLVGIDFQPEMGGGPVALFRCHAAKVFAGPAGADAIADAAIAQIHKGSGNA